MKNNEWKNEKKFKNKKTERKGGKTYEWTNERWQKKKIKWRLIKREKYEGK